jgi:hypothetical protein
MIERVQWNAMQNNWFACLLFLSLAKRRKAESKKERTFLSGLIDQLMKADFDPDCVRL